eukprot:TRINITY_DN17743_c0_g1_i1.p1 TRINITY_DN17743_c0_g1~~TRINITY_DN17743_c0_g1_i1.p1  ORF type:complete len:253 (-),score=69.58 TRINITY_DN17743_c0_g1_i1:422-1180(-)
MARVPIVAGNWKCQPLKRAQVESLAGTFNEACDFDPSALEVVIFPTALHVDLARRSLKETIAVGSQTVCREADKAFTGEICAEMLADMGCSWVLVGHSDRRHALAEDVKGCKEKVEAALAAGLRVLFCIGELLEEREAGQTLDVCMAQLEPVLPCVKDWSRFALVYEPVWALGTGVIATKDQAQEVHQALREFVGERCGAPVAASLRILYGGGVNAGNSPGLINQPDVDGFLAHGASLKPDFAKIVAAVQNS